MKKGAIKYRVANEEKILKMSEVAEMLRLNYCTMSRKAKSGEIPSFKIGGRILFRLSSINGWIDAQEEKNELEHSKKDGMLRRILE